MKIEIKISKTNKNREKIDELKREIARYEYDIYDLNHKEISEVKFWVGNQWFFCKKGEANNTEVLISDLTGDCYPIIEELTNMYILFLEDRVSRMKAIVNLLEK